MIDPVIETDDAPYGTGSPYSIVPGQSFEGTLAAGDSTDSLIVTLQDNTLYHFEIEVVGPEADQAETYANIEITRFNFRDFFDSTLTYHARATTESLLSISEIYYPDGVDPGGYAYKVTMSTLPSEGPVDASADTSTDLVLPVGETIYGSVEGADLDWVKVDLERGKTYVFDLEASGNPFFALSDPVMTLRNAKGGAVWSDDDGGDWFESTFAITAERSGSYWVEIASAVPDRDGTWKLTVADTGSQDGGKTVYSGSQSDDDLFGRDGTDDTFYAGAGDDLMRGRDGRDELHGEAGDDTVLGGRDRDDLSGGDGNDIVSGGGGKDTVLGGDGDDLVRGGKGNDSLRGGAGDDTVTGGEGQDTLSLGAGDDILRGGAGADTFRLPARTSSQELDRHSLGTDTILDFDPAVDTLRMDFSIIGEELTSDTRMLQLLFDHYVEVVDGDAVISFKEAGTLILSGVDDLDLLWDAMEVSLPVYSY